MCAISIHAISHQTEMSHAPFCFRTSAKGSAMCTINMHGACACPCGHVAKKEAHHNLRNENQHMHISHSSFSPYFPHTPIMLWFLCLSDFPKLPNAAHVGETDEKVAEEHRESNTYFVCWFMQSSPYLIVQREMESILGRCLACVLNSSDKQPCVLHVHISKNGFAAMFLFMLPFRHHEFA